VSDYPEVAVGYLHPGEVSASFCMSLLKLMLHETARTGMPPFVLAQRCGTLGLVQGRNDTTRSFLDETGCEWLLWVDADMGFPPDTIQRLLRSADRQTRPVMGGLCFGLRREDTDPDTAAERFRTFPTIYSWREFDDRVGFEVRVDYPRDQVVATSATGAACMLVHRRALEKVRARDGDNWFTQVTHPVGPTTFSEDMSFCIRLAAADVPVHVDTRVKTCHDKGGIFLDEIAWDRQQTLDAPAATAAA
jgi:hypothetical protein